jgi:hypothetical protein
MLRDPSKQEVASSDSLKEDVDRRWKSVQKQIYDDIPFAFEVSQIEEGIAIREGLLNANKLDPRFDWRFDLDNAKFFHRFNLTWVEQHKAIRASFQKHWQEWSTEAQKWIRDLAQNSLKSLLILHGAVAVGALNILTQEPSASLLLAAKLALVFAVLGIVAGIIGQIILFKIVSEASNSIRGRVFTKIRWKKLNALWRYNRRRLKLMYLADYLILGSAFWFCAYSIILLVVLSS